MSERAPTPPRFMEHSTLMVRMGLKPKRPGMRVGTGSTSVRPPLRVDRPEEVNFSLGHCSLYSSTTHYEVRASSDVPESCR